MTIDEVKTKIDADGQWTMMASDDGIKTLRENLKARNFNVTVVENREAALEELKKMIPENAEVMTGSSTTLHEIGFMSHLFSGNHPWKSLVGEMVAEQDPEKQAEMRRQGILSEYFLASANALTEAGQIVAAGLTGSRTGAFPFGAKNLVLVIGTQKIVKDIPAAMERVMEYVFPLEDARAKAEYNMNSAIGRWVILEREPFNPNRVHIILVKEALGF